MRTHARICVCACVYVRVGMCVYVRTCVRACVCVRAGRCVCVCVCVGVCVSVCARALYFLWENELPS